MPQSGFRWYHIILTTRGTWLHGDSRGFRSRNHRIHSSGDYKHRPPQGEHRELNRYHIQRSNDPVIIPRELLAVVGERLLKKIDSQALEVLAISVASTHVHILAELPDDYGGAKRLAGSWKQAASHAIRDSIPGRVWAEGGRPIKVNTPDHQRQAFIYILNHANKDEAWVWSFRERSDPSSRAPRGSA